MVSKLTVLLRRAKDVFRTEGLTPLVRRGFKFVRSWFFQYGNYYLCEHTLKERNEADFLPRIQDFTFKIICNNEEADELAAITGFDFRRRLVNGRERLNKGAIAFCVLIKGELAHIGWVALNEEAKKRVDSLPYKVDFSNNEACTGGTFTFPKYRGNGLMAYGYFRRFQFLREKGIMASRNAVSTINIASVRALSKFDLKIRVRARFIRILWWKSWREIPLIQTNEEQNREIPSRS
jgi:hypothetical protein